MRQGLFNLFYILLFIGIVLFFIVGRFKRQELKDFIKSFSSYNRISAVIGLIVVLPASLFVSYFSLFVGGGSGYTICEAVRGAIEYLPWPEIEGFLIGMLRLLCVALTVFLAGLAPVIGFLYIEIIGACLTLLIGLLFRKLWLITKNA